MSADIQYMLWKTNIFYSLRRQIKICYYEFESGSNFSNKKISKSQNIYSGDTGNVRLLETLSDYTLVCVSILTGIWLFVVLFFFKIWFFFQYKSSLFELGGACSTHETEQTGLPDFLQCGKTPRRPRCNLTVQQSLDTPRKGVEELMCKCNHF